MPEAVALGCAMYGLAPLEALVAATANAAWVLGLHDRIGSLEPGKRADFVVLDTDEFRRVPYRPGHNPGGAAFLEGEPGRWESSPDGPRVPSLPVDPRRRAPSG